KDIPPLEFPKSSEDLMVPNEHIMNVIAIYEVLRNFGTVLRLSPFRFEDFCAALVSQEQCTLMAEMHVVLLKAVLREEDTSNTTFGPADLKDSVNSTLYFIDGMTWPEVLRVYCESDKEYHHVLPYQEAEDYPYGPVQNKIKVLQFLVDQFLTTNIAREELMSEGVIQYDDHCRVCHKLGDLLCCETCSAVYHLECVKPPLEEVPEDEWQCEVCVAHKVPGVTDCVAEIQKNKPYIRHEPIGYDRSRRKYWFLNRRLIIEEDSENEKDKKLWYYSTKVQLAELIDCLDKDYWEAELCKTLEEMREEIHRHMDITEDLTNKARGSNKSFLAAANDEILEATKSKKGGDIEDAKSPIPEEADKDKNESENNSQKDSEKSKQEFSDQPQEKSKEEKTSGGDCEKGKPEEPKDVGDKGNSVSTNTGDNTTNTSSGETSPSEGKSTVGCPSETHDSNNMAEKKVAPELPQDVPDFKSEKSNGERSDSPGTGKGTPGSTRMVTRLRNPDSKLSQLKSQQVAAAAHEANKLFKEGREVLVVNSQGEISRLSTKKEIIMKGNINNFFKLGQEGKYRVYHNQYTTNSFALNKHQHREDHDKRRHLSHKFCLTPAGEFKWNGSVHGSKVLTISTLRLTIIQLENNIPAPFLHPNWASHRSNWIKAVQMCSKPREFALALAILECAIKPVVMLPIWRESLGHTRLHRMTSIEREEKEKEETMQQATWVKYTFPIKHQVWKQKGEEYRVTGYGGWSWISKTHVHRFVPKLPGNTNVNYRKILDTKNLDTGENECELDKRKSLTRSPMKVKLETNPQKSKASDSEMLQEIDQTEMETTKISEKKDQTKEERMLNSESDKPIKEEPMEIDEVKTDSSTRCEESSFKADVINVSEGFHLRTSYKKKVKSSKLDGLLERRVKQFTLEEKQRLEKMKLEGKTSAGPLKSMAESHVLVKAKEGGQASMIDQEKTQGSDSNRTEDLIQECSQNNENSTIRISGSDVTYTGKHSTKGQAQEKVSIQSPEPNFQKQNSVISDVSEPAVADKCQKQDRLKAKEHDIINVDDQPVSQDEKSMLATKKENNFLPVNTTVCLSESVSEPVVHESTCDTDVPATSEATALGEKYGKQACDSENNSTLEKSSESLFTQDSKEEDVLVPNSHKSNLKCSHGNQEQVLEGLKLVSDMSSEKQPLKPREKTSGDMLHCKITEANGKKPSQEQKLESSVNKCHHQINLKNIIDKKNSENGDTEKKGEKEIATAFQINGKDNEFKVFSKDEYMKEISDSKVGTGNVESKVNSIKAIPEHEIKPLIVKEAPVKPFMNGDVIMEDFNEKSNLNTKSCLLSSSDIDGKYQGNVENLTSVKGPKTPSPSCKESSSVNQVENMEVETSETKKVPPSPVTSGEESNLSSDFNDQNGLPANKMENGNGNATRKTVITEVTTTTSTVATESKTVFKVAEVVASQGDQQSVVSSTENCAMSTVTTTTTTVTKLSTPTTGSNVDVISVKEHSKTVVTTTVTDSLTTPGGTLVTSMTVSKEYSTKDKVKLMKFSRPKKTRSGTALPSYRKFVTKSSKKSIFVLPNDDLKKLARKGGIREVPCFNYNAKPALDIWPYPSPRPTFGITWRYRLQTVKSLAGVSLMLRLLWASLRWDDMAAKTPPGGGTTRTETSDTEITTTEIIKRRDVGPYGIRSEYCIRKIICPIGVPEAPKETPTPQRKGLRSSALRPKRPETPKQTGPVIIETWVAEEELELWEIRAFAERVEKEKAQAVEQQAKKRLEQQKQLPTVIAASTTATTNSTTNTVSTPQKVVVAPISGPVTTGTKVVLTTKVGSPATVTFQQNKNFHQTFATWVKQGQSSSGVVQVQQKVLGIIPSSTGASQQTFTSFQPRTATVTIRPNTPGTVGTTSNSQVITGTQIRPGMTVIRTPLQQSTLGKTIIRTPLMVQQGQTQQVVTQIIRGQPVSTAVSSPSAASSSSGQKVVTSGAPVPHIQPPSSTPQPPRPQQGQVKLTMAQLTQLTQGQGGSQGLTVVIQGQGQTTGQLQLIPQGVTVIPGPGQQLMQAAMPNGTIQRFLFTPLPTTATAASTTTTVSTSTSATSEQKQTTQTQAQPIQALPSAQQPSQSQPQAPSPTVQPSPQPQTPAQTQPQSPSQAQPQPQAQPEAQTHAEVQTQATASSPVTCEAQPVLTHSNKTPVTIQCQSQSQVQGQSPVRVQSPPQARVLPQASSTGPTVCQASVQTTASQPVQIQPHTSIQIQSQVVMKHNAVIEHLKQKKTMTPAEREENQRMIVCNQVMKFILDKIDKEEKQAAKKRKREESVEQKRSKQNATKLSALLFKHKEQLKAEILKKRALLDKDLQIEVQVGRDFFHFPFMSDIHPSCKLLP
uniref:Bromodomain PHD finger transcription factor n=1 Tax=Vombatus ursinus TaxID=29139 RepID=A0A4X2L843_VOMUR